MCNTYVPNFLLFICEWTTQDFHTFASTVWAIFVALSYAFSSQARKLYTLTLQSIGSVIVVPIMRSFRFVVSQIPFKIIRKNKSIKPNAYVRVQPVSLSDEVTRYKILIEKISTWDTLEAHQTFMTPDCCIDHLKHTHKWFINLWLLKKDFVTYIFKCYIPDL